MESNVQSGYIFTWQQSHTEITGKLLQRFNIKKDMLFNNELIDAVHVSISLIKSLCKMSLGESNAHKWGT